MNSKNIGKRIFELRKKNNLSQKDLASKLCVSNKTISKWECGNSIPDIETSNKIAKIFNISIDSFINEDIENNTTFNQSNNNIKNSFISQKIKLTVLFPSICLVLVAITLLCYFFVPRTPEIKNSNIFTIDNDAYSLSCSVSNSASTFSFNEVFSVPLTNDWKLYFDINGTNEISSKTVNIEIGDNTFYVIVENSANAKNVYTVNIRRKPIYTITFNVNDTIIETINIEEGMSVLEPNVTMPFGYSSFSWDKPFNNIATANVDYVVEFIPDIYSISYVLNGGTNDVSNPSAYTIEDNILLKKATKEGYLFIGWFNDKNLTIGITNIYLSTNDTDNKTIYAGFLEEDSNGNTLINNSNELISLANGSSCFNTNFLLTNDIDLGGIEWSPIGNMLEPFTGMFDGNGHTISNFRITKSQQFNGLFGYAQSGNIKNLGVENFTIYYINQNVMDIYAGGLVGNSNFASIINCYAIGNIDITNTNGVVYAGGLIGYTKGTIRYCYTTGNISATVSSTNCNAYAGGLVGSFNSSASTIMDSYSTSNVSAIAITSLNCNSYAGGLVGYTEGPIFNCYTTGYVSATATSVNCNANAGGLVGYADLSYATIQKCYAIGNITSNGSALNRSSVAGLAAFATNGLNIRECYRYSGQILTQYNIVDSGSNLIGTSADMTTIWDFACNNWDSSIWNLSLTSNPILKDNHN